jgi:hypothetical protein
MRVLAGDEQIRRRSTAGPRTTRTPSSTRASPAVASLADLAIEECGRNNASATKPRHEPRHRPAGRQKRCGRNQPHLNLRVTDGLDLSATTAAARHHDAETRETGDHGAGRRLRHLRQCHRKRRRVEGGRRERGAGWPQGEGVEGERIWRGIGEGSRQDMVASIARCADSVRTIVIENM